MREITNTEDIIDSRDVIERIEELQTMLDDTDVPLHLRLTWDEAQELVALRELADQGECDAEDWFHGATLIRDSYFETYARELAEELYLSTEVSAPQWPYTHIDWEAAAEELLIDYTHITYGDVTYYVR